MLCRDVAGISEASADEDIGILGPLHPLQWVKGESRLSKHYVTIMSSGEGLREMNAVWLFLRDSAFWDLFVLRSKGESCSLLRYVMQQHTVLCSGFYRSWCFNTCHALGEAKTTFPP